MNNLTQRGPFKPDDVSQWFWVIIEKADRSRDRLHNILQEMTREELIRFHDEFQEAAAQLADEPFINFMEEGLSEDGVQDVAEWVVSQGKSLYSEIWEHPERIPANVEPGCTGTMSGVVNNVFWERFKQSIPDEVN